MGKDKSKKSELGSGTNKLAHNPFAQLKERFTSPESPLPSAPQLVAPPAAAPAKASGRLIQRRETKQRGGKAVIVVSGFGALAGFDRAALEALARELKAKLGCGGTVEEDASGPTIVIQGEQARKLAELLRAKGFRVDGVVS